MESRQAVCGLRQETLRSDAAAAGARTDPPGSRLRFVGSRPTRAIVGHAGDDDQAVGRQQARRAQRQRQPDTEDPAAEHHQVATQAVRTLEDQMDRRREGVGRAVPDAGEQLRRPERQEQSQRDQDQACERYPSRQRPEEAQTLVESAGEHRTTTWPSTAGPAHTAERRWPCFFWKTQRRRFESPGSGSGGHRGGGGGGEVAWSD